MADNATSQSAPEFHRYSAYGISIRSDAPLPLPQAREPTLFGIEIRTHHGPIGQFMRERIGIEESPSPAFHFAHLSDGSNYVRLQEVGEFLISRDGRSIRGHRFPRTSSESFHVYLLGQALSFALVKNGFEPLHATVVVVEGRAVAFLGDCGFGKSTLAAEFLREGYRLLTDDLLVLRRIGQQVLAYPGPSRIKLFPEMARRFLGHAITRVSMNPHTRKIIVPLNQNRTRGGAVPFAGFYALASPDEMALETNIRITTLSPREAFLRLLASSFNNQILQPDRLRRQFEATEALANSIALRELSYPRKPEYLPLVREAILSDVLAKQCEFPPCIA